MADRPHATLCLVTPNGISQFLPCNKSNTTARAVLLLVSSELPTAALSYDQRNVGGFHPLAIREELGNLSAGSDRFQPAIS